MWSEILTCCPDHGPRPARLNCFCPAAEVSVAHGPIGPAAPATDEPSLLAVILIMLKGLLGGVGGGGNREGACLMRDLFSSLRVKNERSDNVTPSISHRLADICN